jgi:long-chain acyl-CoA synthetase
VSPTNAWARPSPSPSCPSDGRAVTAAELVEFLAPRLAKHKIPEHIYILDEPLPRNASGKFLKRELRKQLTGY